MSKPRRTATSLLQQLSAGSGTASEQTTSPFGALGDLVRRNAAEIMDPGYCDDLVGRLLKTGKASIRDPDARLLLQVSDLASTCVHPYFIRAAARQGVAFYIDSGGSLNRQTFSRAPDVKPIELDGSIEADFYIEPEWFAHLAAFIEAGLSVLLIGPSGSGKSEAVERLFRKRDQPLEVVSCTPSMSADDFEGTIDLVDGNTVFTPAPSAVAVRDGHGLLLDEVDASPAEACFSLYRALDGRDMRISRMGFEGTIVPHPNFRAVGTQNTEGRGDDRGIHHGRAFQDEAFLDRWSNFIRTDYLPHETELLVLCKRTGLDADRAGMVLKAATELRRAFANDQIMLCMTMRRTLAVAANIAAGMTPEDAWRFAVQNRAAGSDVQDIDDLVNRIYGASIRKR
ncbi:MAG: AAA family ATPase [Nitrospira sp.]